MHFIRCPWTEIRDVKLSVKLMAKSLLRPHFSLTDIGLSKDIYCMGFHIEHLFYWKSIPGHVAEAQKGWQHSLGPWLTIWWPRSVRHQAAHPSSSSAIIHPFAVRHAEGINTNGGLMPDIMTIGTVFAFYQYNPTLVRFAKNEGLWTIFTFTDHTNLRVHYLNLTAQSQRLFPDMQTVVSNGSFILVLPFCFMVESARPGSCVMGPWVYAMDGERGISMSRWHAIWTSLPSLPLPINWSGSFSSLHGHFCMPAIKWHWRPDIVDDFSWFTPAV